MTSDRPEVWFIYPRESEPFMRDLVRSECSENGWGFQGRPTTRKRLSNGPVIRTFTPEDATNLYRSIHTRRIGVWQIGDASAPVVPNPNPNRKHYVSLNTFVRYKAFHRRVDASGFGAQLSEMSSAFQSWIESIDCEGESDPRCLPFHVFDTDDARLRSVQDR